MKTNAFSALFGKGTQPNIVNVQKLDKYVSASQNKRLNTGELTGSAVMVNQFGKTVYTGVFGKQSAGGQALREDAIYRIASMTKPVCAVAMLLAYQQGLVDIYADVAEYLPAYAHLQVAQKDAHGNVVGVKPAQNRIKVVQLVSHTSGLTGDTKVNEYADKQGGKSLATVADYLPTLPLQFEPNTAQFYCTEAFDVMARIIELTSGQEFSQYLQDNLFSVLGMQNTGFEPTEAQWKAMVAVHHLKNGKAVDDTLLPGCLFGDAPVSYHGAGACLFSTLSDYMKFAEMLLHDGKTANGTEVLTNENIKLLQTPVVDESIMPGSQKWGLGVRVITDDKYWLPKGCFGWSGAFGTHFWVDPGNAISAVYMKNSKYDGGAGAKTANEFEKDLMKALCRR